MKTQRGKKYRDNTKTSSIHHVPPHCWNDNLGLWEMWFIYFTGRIHKSKQNTNLMCNSVSGFWCEASAKCMNIIESLTFNSRRQIVILSSFGFLSMKTEWSKESHLPRLHHCLLSPLWDWHVWGYFQQCHLKLPGFIGTYDVLSCHGAFLPVTV